ncbi:MAG TPA: DUF2167 domain-containing protein [Pyrinomonadaceae bacterium]|nr:DUF2167 domain-containing protein [Pyrinomonadaceae bacterium]
MKALLIVCLCLLAFPPLASASKKKPGGGSKSASSKKEKEPPAEDVDAEAAAFESQLEYRRGRIVLPGDIATLDVPENFRYLAPEQADKILVEAWGNPPGTKTLGMLFPSDVSPLSEEGWGVVITYDEDGHVDDGDANAIDYDEMLKQMREDTAENNKERAEKGYQPMTLYGWAAAPHYDASAHKLYWARELSVGGSPQHTLNYDIRILGRKGVLSFNAIAAMSRLGDIEESMKQVMAFSDFNAGQRYADFDSKTDNLAAYGIGALVAGKVAAKVGLFKLMLGAILAAKKLVVVAVVAVGGIIARLLGRKKD